MKRIASLLLALLLLCTALSPMHPYAFAEFGELEPPPILGPEIPEPDPPAGPELGPEGPGQDPIIPIDPGDPGTSGDPGQDPGVPSPPPYQPPVVTPTQPEISTMPSNTLPRVTKDPTDETVKADGYAEFVARAEYSYKTIWHLKSPTGGTDILAKNAPYQFPGIWVTGLETERLGLDHIPRELDQWQVYAEFVNSYGTVHSLPAVITIKSEELTPPKIYEEPKSVQLKANEATMLRAGAVANESDVKLTYQWYSNTTNSNEGGRAIAGADSPTYTPDYVPGTTYYYCSIRANTTTLIGEPVKTQCAAVTYEAIEPTTVPTTAPVTVPSTAPSETAAAPTVATTQPASQENVPPAKVFAPKRDNSLLIIVVIAIIVIALLGILATVLILRFVPGSDDDEEEYEEYDEEEYEFMKPETEEVTQDDNWDDLSDLTDLSFYLGNDDEEV